MSWARPELSVVVCTYNGAAKLPLALASLTRQTVGPDRYEVVVVDDGSTDGTVSVARRHGARVISLPVNAGLAAARNAGVAGTQAELIAFTDDDCEVSEDWVERLIAAFEDPGLDAVGGAVRPECADPFVRAFLQAHNPLVPLEAELLSSTRPAERLARYLCATLRGPQPAPTWLYSVVGANMAFRRRVILAVGGFDEAFRFGGEEEDLCRRLHRRDGGARIRYLPEARVAHWFEGTVADVLRRARAYGRGNARSALKHAEVRPIAYPFPVLVTCLAGMAVSRRWPRAAALAAAAPLALYPGWLRVASHARSAAPLAHPYLRLAQEVATMIGELQGLRAGYRAVPSAHLDPAALA